MDESTAQTVVLGITAGGSLVWFIAYVVLRRASKWRRPESAAGDSSEAGTEVVSADHYASSIVVQGETKDLLEKASSLIAKESLSTVGSLKIINRSSDSLEVEQVSSGMGNRQMNRLFRRAKIQFTSLGGGRTQIDYVLELSPLRWMLIIGWLAQTLGLIALLVGCWAMYHFVATSANPAVRGQSFQMIQVIHFLWPPFLFAGLFSRGRKATVGQFEAFVHNLPYATL